MMSTAMGRDLRFSSGWGEEQEMQTKGLLSIKASISGSSVKSIVI